MGQFPELFADLETQQRALGVQSFGVSLTTLEEVSDSAREMTRPEKPVDDNAANAQKGE